MIEARSLSRHYGDFTAVDDLSFVVNEGEIVGILGPNGAGKTTTIRMLTGFLPPSSGTVTVDGIDLDSQPIAARRRIGYLPENVALYTDMRVCEYFSYRARLQGMGRADGRTAIGEVLERCLLQEVEKQIIGTLSKGFRQRVGLGAAILHRPPVLVLDEPTVGLDPKQIIAIRELVRELGESRTLMLSTHILPEVEQLCHRVLIIDRGRIVAEGTPQELSKRFQGQVLLYVTVKGNPAEAAQVLAGIAGVERVEASTTAGRLEVFCQPDSDLREEVFRAAVERSWVLLELAERKASLEDVFVRLISGTIESNPAESDSPAAAKPAEDSPTDHPESVQ